MEMKWTEKKASAVCERLFHAGSRGRTDTRFKSNGILSPARLPIPPCRQGIVNCRIRARLPECLLCRNKSAGLLPGNPLITG